MHAGRGYLTKKEAKVHAFTAWMSHLGQFRKSARLLDHFVGQRKQLRRNFQSECLGGLEVYNEFECC
jgi:hypothetical protein